MRDKKFLAWIHERLVHVHNENPNYDYMWRLRQIIHETPEQADTSNTPHMMAKVISDYAEDIEHHMELEGEIVDRKVTD